MTNKKHSYNWEAMRFKPDEDVIQFAFLWYKTPQGGIWWSDNQYTPEGKAEFARINELYAEDMAAKEGPVRTVTRKEIVPGVYGRIAVFENDYSKSVLIRLADAGGEVDLNQDGHYFDAGQLTNAMKTLTQIRDALKENE